MCTVLAAAIVATACGLDQPTGAQIAGLQKQADMYSIDQIEATFHKALAIHDVGLMMSLWANNATFQVGTETYRGKDQIQNFFVNKAAPYRPQNNWVADTPAYKIRITVNGDTGTLYFECDFIDVATRTVKAVLGSDMNVERVNGQWLIANGVSATPILGS
jgi:hypothetical protein